MLWQKGMVMRDDQTGSLWPQLLGRSLQGDLKGQSLKPIEASLTTWKWWKENFADTTVMNLSQRRPIRRDRFDDLSKYVVGVSVDEKTSKAWAMDRLAEQPLLNDYVGDKQIVIRYDSSGFQGFVFERSIDEQTTLEFELSGEQVIDKQTGSTWNLRLGLAMEGPLAGKRLKSLPAFTSFATAWRDFHPESSYGSFN